MLFLRCVINIQFQKIGKKLEELTILPEFFDWALEVLNSRNDQETDDMNSIHDNLLKTLAKTETQISSLTQLRYRDMITDDEFNKERGVLIKKRDNLKERVGNTEREKDNWYELTERTFEFARYGKGHFENGNIQAKREIFDSLGKNFLLKDGELTLESYEWLTPIQTEYKNLEKEYLALEPHKKSLSYGQTGELNSIRLRWQAQKDSNPHQRFWRPVC